MLAAAPRARHLGPLAVGLGLTLLSAVAFSWIGILTQLGYDGGATVGTVLSGRFVVGAAILWAVVLTRHAPRPGARQLVRSLALGVGYSGHAWLFSASLARLDAGLVDLLLFTYPALVMLGAVALGRERFTGLQAVAVGATIFGAALVLVGGLGSLEPTGVGLALGSAVAYAIYILTSAGELQRTDPVLLVALVATAAAVVLTVAAAARDDLSFGLEPSGAAAIVALGVVTVIGMSAFIAGIAILGPSRASIVSAVQPALTPIVGFVVFADWLDPTQVLGGAIVVASVVVLECRRHPPEGLLSVLPRPERRMLARATMAVDVPAGGRIIHEGTLPSRFYLIERGHALVSRGARTVAQLGPGDCFGELALLHGGTTSASVEATTDMRVHAVSHHDFLHAVASLPTLARVVGQLAQERLALTPQAHMNLR